LDFIVRFCIVGEFLICVTDTAPLDSPSAARQYFVAVLASLAPARRAASVQPMVVMRVGLGFDIKTAKAKSNSFQQ